MKHIYLLISISILISCKNQNKQEKQEISKVSVEQNHSSDSEKIASAHGIKQWDRVKKLRFTFNVDVNENHSERSWIWEPKTDDVTMITSKDTISYNRKSIDSVSLSADRGFINDKFWLLAPFQIIWDSGTEISKPVISTAPISNVKLNKITLTYNGNGGYTPGDAYDFYYSDDFIVQEWVYRRGNSTEPSLTTTFENYQSYQGIKIARDHKQKDVDWNLYFTDIEVIMEKTE